MNDPRASRRFWQWFADNPTDVLLVALPLALGARYWGASDLWIFATSCLAIIPLAGLLGRATEHLVARFGAGIGGLLNATFGNAAELLLALMALRQGPKMYPLVKASITGSIIGNVLLVLGLSITVGGLRYKQQSFNRPAAGTGATLLTLATVGLIVPTLYYYVFANAPLSPEQLHAVEWLSDEIAVILAGVYVLSLVFTFGTHRGVIESQTAALIQGEPEDAAGPPWSRRKSMLVLLAATAGVAAMSELLVESAENAAHQLGMSAVFVGVVIVAIVGNAAEHSTAVMMAWKNKMDLSVNIAVGSGIQIALFVAPVLVFASMAMGHHPTLDLHFTQMEIIAVTISIAVLALICQDGETNWLEGVMLLAVYAILALAFYHLGEIAPPESSAS